MSHTIFRDATAEEIKALGYDAEDLFNRPSPWTFKVELDALREKVVLARQGATEPAAEGPDTRSDDKSPVRLDKTEQTREGTGAIGRNGLVLINDPDWIDLTDRNWDYMRHVYRSDLNHADKSVLGVVAMHCGVNSRGCHASNETLAAEANIDKDNFRKRLSRLTKEGWVRENGSMPAVQGNKDGTKIRHIGVRKTWVQDGGS